MSSDGQKREATGSATSAADAEDVAFFLAPLTVQSFAEKVKEMPRIPQLLFFEKQLNMVQQELDESTTRKSFLLHKKSIATKSRLLHEMWNDVKIIDGGAQTTLYEIFENRKHGNDKKRKADPLSKLDKRSTSEARVESSQEEEEEEEEEAEGVLGCDIVEKYPNALHFVAGVAYFDMNPKHPDHQVADNIEFRAIITDYFRAQLQDEAFIQSMVGKGGRTTYRVIAHIEGILEAARNTPMERLQGRPPDRVYVWKRIRTEESLRASTWQTFFFKDVTSNIYELKDALQPPAKTALKNLYPPRDTEPY